MGFNLYLAGGDAVPIDLTYEDNLGILTTFADGPSTVKKFIDKRQCKTFCDSGAYGAAHSGKVINLDSYIEFINSTPECEVFAVLDEIPWSATGYLDGGVKAETANKTWENYVYMLERVKPEYRDKLVCAFHYGEPKEALHRIISGIDGYKPKYIAFGGRAGVSTRDLYKYFDTYFWKWIRESVTPDIKIHAFGVTVFDMLERYPWYSADSTSWLRTGITGSIYSRHAGFKVINVSNQRQGAEDHIYNLTPQLRDMIVNEIESRGFTVKQLGDDYKARNIWNALYFKDWADNFEYKPVKITKRKGFCKSL